LDYQRQDLGLGEKRRCLAQLLQHCCDLVMYRCNTALVDEQPDDGGILVFAEAYF
jgi:hypothetical protein